MADFTLPFLITWTASFIALLIAAYCDVKTREVPDWLNFSLIAFGIGTAVLASIIYWDYHYILASVIGLAVCMGVAYLMYYTGQWGGGDAKLLMGVGANIGLDIFSASLVNLPFLADFFIDILLAGAAYGLVWVGVLAIRNRKVFVPAFNAALKERHMRIFRIIAIAFAIIGIACAFLLPPPFRYMVFGLCAAIFFMFYLWALARIVERTCMRKEVPVEKLTEGDWILKDVIVDGKRITDPKDLGISKEQIAKLIALQKKKKISRVWIKTGIPFVPSFLIGFLIASFLPMWYLIFF